jgi:hypothetical protein
MHLKKDDLLEEGLEWKYIQLLEDDDDYYYYRF